MCVCKKLVSSFNVLGGYIASQCQIINCGPILRYDHTTHHFLILGQSTSPVWAHLILNQWMSLGPYQSFIHQMILKNAHCPVSKIF